MRYDFGIRGRGCEISPSFEPKKEPSHEETTQTALTLHPVERGCSFGSVKYYGEKGCLRNNLMLQEAVFPLYSSPFLLDRLPFHYVIILQPLLSFQANYILAHGGGINSGTPPKRNGSQRVRSAAVPVGIVREDEKGEQE